MNRWIIAVLAAVFVIGGATFLARADDNPVAPDNPPDSVCSAGNDVRILLPIAQQANPGEKIKIIEITNATAALGLYKAIIASIGDPPEALAAKLEGTSRVALIDIGDSIFTKVFFYDKDGCYITGLNMLAPQVLTIIRDANLVDEFKEYAE